MADISKLKKIRGLGDPPPVEEARVDLGAAPEIPIAPAAEVSAAPVPAQAPAPVAVSHHARIDGRSLRRSGRTVHFATKVTPEYDNRIREIAEQTGKLMTEILEESLAAYEKQLGNR
jgi:hypothetical protein